MNFFKISFIGLITAASSLVYLFTITGFFGNHNWFLDLTSHFRLYYFLYLLFIIVIYLIYKKYFLVFLSLIFLIINFSTIIVLYVKKSHPIATGKVYTLFSANIHTSNKNYNKLLKTINYYQPDFILLLETDEVWLDKLIPLYENYPYTVIQPRADNFGIAFFSKHPLSNTEIYKIQPINIPTIITTIHLSQKITFVGTHPLPPINQQYSNHRNLQLQQLAKKIPKENIILAGDLNITPWSFYFKNFLKQTGLKNSLQGFGIQGSWPANFTQFLALPIDHMLYSQQIGIFDRKIANAIGSDHLPVIIDFYIKD